MPDAAPEKNRSYKPTLNLPKTRFPMKANLVQNEPATLTRWQKQNLYQKTRNARTGADKYVFHDGPPYANGSIHLGHLLNKVLKDFVVRSKTMAGYDCPYVPGWDCHGLPIEHKVMAELGDQASGMEPFQIRRKCKASAEKFVKLQSGQMQRLLTLADYDHPYLTMTPAYEAAVLEVFADLVKKGLVYRALKPVHWSIANQTALADAELEYRDRQDTSVYVLFEVVGESRNELLDRFRARTVVPTNASVDLMIWTTTPWTLPANMAVAVHESHGYTLVKWKDSRFAVIATNLVEKVLAKSGSNHWQVVGEPVRAGSVLDGLRYRHPLTDRTSPVVTAAHVTLEDGTGLVHTAPGHGVEDYQTCLRCNLQFKRDALGTTNVHQASHAATDPGPDIYCPVQPDGTYDQTVPDWLRGVDIWQANPQVVKKLHDTGHLFHQETITHSYPHDWRSKTPVIFRATEQWFVGVETPVNGSTSVRKMALDVTQQDTRFIPEWGRNRMRGMLETRPDWCISRQRAWGLPIPAFLGPQDGQVLLTAVSVRAVADRIAQQGSDVWFKATPFELLSGYDPAADPDAPDWLKQTGRQGITQLTPSSDIFDVWFESGSSWNAVLRARGLGYPADLYLEGSDQHRGWFQLSLLPALGATGIAPFRSVLTHGFMVDKDGKKMSKSGGNALEVDTLLKDFGADVCRWWVGSLNADNDIKVDHEFFRVAGEEYRKVRNTIRYLLSNLSDFDRDTDGCRLNEGDAASLDAWAAQQLNRLVDRTCRAYEAFQFRKVHEAVFHFCNDTLSAVYLAATKDRLYCDRPDSPRRRRTQTVIHDITDALIRLVAPVLPHTADEAWQALHGQDSESVHLTRFPEVATGLVIDPSWDQVMAIRDNALKAIEDARTHQRIDNPLDCGLQIEVRPTQDPSLSGQCLTAFDPVDLADLCGISRVDVVTRDDTASPPVAFKVVDLRDQPRCERCWKRDPTVKPRSDGGMLSDRDAQALGLD